MDRDKLFNLINVNKVVRPPLYWDDYREDEFLTQLEIAIPGYHFELWYESDDTEIELGDIHGVVDKMLKYKNASEIYSTDISGEDYTILIIAFKQ